MIRRLCSKHIPQTPKLAVVCSRIWAAQWVEQRDTMFETVCFACGSSSKGQTNPRKCDPKRSLSPVFCGSLRPDGKPVQSGFPTWCNSNTGLWGIGPSDVAVRASPRDSCSTPGQAASGKLRGKFASVYQSLGGIGCCRHFVTV